MNNKHGLWLVVLVLASVAMATVWNTDNNVWKGLNTFTQTTTFSGAVTQTGASAVSGITTRTSYVIDSYAWFGTTNADGLDTVTVAAADTGDVTLITPGFDAVVASLADTTFQAKAIDGSILVKGPASAPYNLKHEKTGN